MSVKYIYFQYLSLPPLVAPLKCCVLPLLDNDKFTPLVSMLCKYYKKSNM